MINIIENLWQAEVKGVRILPTIIKLKGNTAKSYFFSDKQMRILRKKEQTTQMGLQTLGIGKSKDQPNKQCLKIKLISAKKIEFEVILESEVNGLLLNLQDNFSLVGIQNSKQVDRLIECRYDFVYNSFRSRELMRIHTPNKIWRSPTYEQLQQFPKNTQKLQIFCANLAKQLCTKLKITSICRLIDVIIVTNQQFSQLYVVWSNNFSFSQQQFFSIDYELVEPHEKQQQQQLVRNSFSINRKNTLQKNICSPIKHMISQEQINPSKQTNIEIDNHQSFFECWGCGKKSMESTCKQLSNQDIISLRRKNRLSIMGIFEQYLPVCVDCYESTDY